MPTVPVKAAGWRIEPPVSVAVAPAQILAATAAAEPPDEPPGTNRPARPLASAALPCSAVQFGGSTGLATVPKADVSFDEPMANSSLLSLPSITAPSRHRFALTVDS